MQSQEDEQRLLQVVWSLLRAGAKKEALEFCRQSGQNWRAASLSAALSTEPLLLSTGAHPPCLFLLLLPRHVDASCSPSIRFAATADDGTQSSYHMWQLACRAISNEVRPSSPCGKRRE